MIGLKSKMTIPEKACDINQTKQTASDCWRHLAHLNLPVRRSRQSHLDPLLVKVLKD